MKRIKKVASLALALVMAMAMTLTAFAADNDSHTITVTQNEADKTQHTYEAYQIFAGDLAEVDGEKVLSNITWGSGVNGDALLAALKSDKAFDVVLEDEMIGLTNAFADCTTAAQVAEVLSGAAFENSGVKIASLTDAFARVAENNLTSTVAGTATGVGDVKINVVGSGYYLIKDKNGTVVGTPDANGNQGSYTRFMLEVVDDATATVKSEVPSGDKQVYINITTDGTTLGEANNTSIGSHVSYEITSKVPNHTGYNYYYFIMNDTLCEGLTFDGADTVTVKVGDTTLVQGTDYYVYTGTAVAPKTFRLAFANIIDYPIEADIVVTYSATVNDQAKIGSEGNPNTWTLQYSNNPDDTFGGDGRPDGQPGLPLDENSESLGETPEEKTLTYVTELDITKYANKALEEHLLGGAEFTLSGVSKQVVLNTVKYYEKVDFLSSEGTHWMLLDGTYTTTAPSTNEYVEIGVGTAETKTGYIKDADGKFVVPKKQADYEGKTLYKLVKGNVDTYADVNQKYKEVTATETVYVDAPVSIELTTPESGKNKGKIFFKGLGAGEYVLTETVTPEGYNTLEPINIVISFRGPEVVNTGDEPGFWGMTWDGKSVTPNDNGIFAQDVINQSGSLLPSTGGIGTTIFYVVGGILVIGAGILLVTKKRMNAR